jgi:hypothetical protein
MHHPATAAAGSFGGGGVHQPAGAAVRPPALGERLSDLSKETYAWLRDYVTAIK